LERSLVLVIDVQNDFASPQGAFNQSGGSARPVQRMLPRLAAFLDEARRRRAAIAFFRHEYDVAGLAPITYNRDRLKYGPPPGYPLPGSWGADFCPPIAPLPGEPVFVKNHYSIFSSATFRDFVQRAGIETLILTGLFTNVCVQAAAWASDSYGYYAVLLQDCVASSDAGLHRAALANISQFLGWVCPAGQLLASWDASPAT
jgi:ureidoacrylate peracid hydrolase